MENTPKEKAPQPKEPKKKGSITGLLVGVIVFLFLTMVGILLFVFTDLGNTLYNQVKVEEGTQTEVGEQEETEDIEDIEIVSLENEGWALYSIPEYGFSVEIPSTSEYHNEFDQYMRWEISRSKINKFSQDSLEQIHLDYYPSGFSPQAGGCGQGCHGEIQITVNYYDKDTQYDLESMKAEKRASIVNWNKQWEQDEGYEPVTIEDYMEDSDPFGENVWCVNLPGIADSNFRECYFEKGDYLIEIVHTGLDLTDFGTDVKSSDLYNILNSMKFE
jgi:hypothetical protein